LDDTGQVYETKSKLDRKYGKGGQLLVSKHRKYTYNDCGDLVEKVEADGKTWRYAYNPGGLLEKVLRPDGLVVCFAYDPLSRRISKTFDGKTTKYVWDGNKIIHEWVETLRIPEALPAVESADSTSKHTQIAQPPVQDTALEALCTWLFKDGNFTPIAQLADKKAYTVISDHLGTPNTLLDETGKKVWSTTYDLWGRPHKQGTTKVVGGAKIQVVASKTAAKDVETQASMPFRFPGQYEDVETGLYYNRFRYYMPDEGMYTQRDPIGLRGGNPTVYGYVRSTLKQIDPFGLTGTYYFTNGTTSYVGKGPESRMNTSMNQRIGGRDNATQHVHRDFGSDEMGLMVEAHIMDVTNAVDSPNFANAINSPGQTLLENASPEVQAEVAANAQEMLDDFDSQAQNSDSANSNENGGGTGCGT